jgi:hypothetical protein
MLPINSVHRLFFLKQTRALGIIVFNAKLQGVSGVSLIAVPGKVFPAAGSDAILPVRLFGLSNLTLAVVTGMAP